MQLKKTAVALVTGAAMLFGAASAQAQQKLTVWWVKGFYKSEDDALYDAIKTGVELADKAPGADDSIRGVVVLTDGLANRGQES